MKRILALLLAALLAGAVLAGVSGSAAASTAPDGATHHQPEPTSVAQGPRVLVLGDSMTARARGKLRRMHPAWHIDGVRGRNVRRLPELVTRHLEEHGAPRTLVVALGSNSNPRWTRDDYREAVALVPATTTVVFVTTYRDPAVFGEERSRTLLRYSRWMRQVAAERPRSCVVPWRSRVVRRPYLLVDGVHATEQGEQVWARLVSNQVRSCWRTTS